MFVKVLKKRGNDVARIYLKGNLICESVIDDTMTKQERKDLNETYILKCAKPNATLNQNWNLK